MATPEPKVNPLSASDIAAQRFNLSKRGLDQDEVRNFLQAVADHVSRLEGEVEWLRARNEHLESRGSAAQEAAYERLSRVFEDAVRRADEAAAKIRIRSEAEAKARIDAAGVEAARIALAAREEADRLLGVAREEASWLREQAAENVERTRRMAEGVHPSMPRATPASPPEPEKPLADIWGSEKTPKPEDFDLKLDASLADLFGDSD